MTKYKAECKKTKERRKIAEKYSGVKNMSINYGGKKDKKGEDIIIIELEEEKGSILLSHEEKEALKMKTGFMIENRINYEDVEVEMAAMATKYRWERRKEIEEKIDDEEENKPPNKGKQIEAESRMSYNHDRKTYNGNRKRPTDIEGCASIKLPGPLNPKDEAEISIRMESYRKVIKKYREENKKTEG